MALDYNRVRIMGSLPGGEKWSVNPAFTGAFEPVISDYADLLAWATAIGGINSGNVLPSNLRAQLSSSGAVEVIRVEYIDSAGRLGQAAEYTLPSSAAGTGSPARPLQVAVVASLLTGMPGRSRRGRLYWPSLATALGSGGTRFSAVQCQGIADDTSALMSAIGSVAPTTNPMVLCVVSKARGDLTVVTQISVGDVPDTQRRRRDKLVENLQYAVYPPTP